MNEATREGLRRVLEQKKILRDEHRSNLKLSQGAAERSQKYLNEVEAEIEAIEADLIKN